MKLLERVRNVLGLQPQPEAGHWWPVGLMALAVPVALLLASTGILPAFTPAAQADGERKEGERPVVREGEGNREGGDRERETGRRVSREGEAGRRVSAEGERGRRASAESGARQRGGADAELAAPPSALVGFQPITHREKALYDSIMQLQRELAELRRQVQHLRTQPAAGRGDAGRGRSSRESEGVRSAEEEGAPRGLRDGEGGGRRGPRDGEGPARSGPRDGEGSGKSGPRDGEGRGKTGPRE